MQAIACSACGICVEGLRDVKACLLDARESFLSLLPAETLALVKRSYIQVESLAFTHAGPTEWEIELPSSPDDFNVGITLRYDIRIYCLPPVFHSLSARDHSQPLITAARCSDASVHLYPATKVLDFLKKRICPPETNASSDNHSFSFGGFGFGELELMMALNGLLREIAE